MDTFDSAEGVAVRVYKELCAIRSEISTGKITGQRAKDAHNKVLEVERQLRTILATLVEI